MGAPHLASKMWVLSPEMKDLSERVLMTSSLSCWRKLIPSLAAAIILVFLSGAAAFAAPITGVVMNLTSNKPSAGDTVALIRLQQGMQVAVHATTDARGHYTLDVTDADPMHLVRVTHEGANYFHPAPPGTQTVNVEVYDAAEKVAGVSTEADVQRMETDQNGLHVIENYFVKNASSPPRTQFGPRAYEIFLPKDAQIVSAAALGPGSMPVQSSPVPLGPPGDYTFIFPLRPGETRFQVSYRLSYSGSVQFQPRVGMPVDNFALILPKTMHFAATPATAFQPIDEDVNVQTYLAKNVTPGSNLAFRLSGTGRLPHETAATQGTNGAQPGNAQTTPANPEEAAQAAAVNNTRPGIGLGVPLDTPDPLHKYKWWIISIAAILLATGAGVLMKQTAQLPSTAGTPVGVGGMPLATTPVAMHNNPGDHRAMVLQALKEELFALESERLAGHMAPEEYDRQKSALEIVMKRALERDTTKSPAV